MWCPLPHVPSTNIIVWLHHQEAAQALIKDPDTIDQSTLLESVSKQWSFHPLCSLTTPPKYSRINLFSSLDPLNSCFAAYCAKISGHHTSTQTMTACPNVATAKSIDTTSCLCDCFLSTFIDCATPTPIRRNCALDLIYENRYSLIA